MGTRHRLRPVSARSNVKPITSAKGCEGKSSALMGREGATGPPTLSLPRALPLALALALALALTLALALAMALTLVLALALALTVPLSPLAAGDRHRVHVHRGRVVRDTVLQEALRQ